MGEQQYLDLVKLVLEKGINRNGTKSIFGHQMRFDLTNNKLPLLTTKRVFFRGVAEELLWFISGKTNAKILHNKGVRIWDDNAAEDGELGPIYGYQWRHFGASYPEKGGVDQLGECVELLREDPFSRRIIMNAWNPVDLPNMALPPCHVMCQFYVSEKRELSCHMYQRSCDIGLGLPFNIASYALLTHMMAAVTDMTPKDLVMSFGDVHIYNEHIEGLTEQSLRVPSEFPSIFINPRYDIDDFKYEDFEVKNYNPQASIPFKLVVT